MQKIRTVFSRTIFVMIVLDFNGGAYKFLLLFTEFSNFLAPVFSEPSKKNVFSKI